MLYASTRSSLIATLGLRTQRLANQIIATTKAELTFPKPDEPVSLGELSIREKELAEIKAAEAESAHGTGRRTNLVTSTGLEFPFSDEAKAALKALASGEGYGLVQIVQPLLPCTDNSVSRTRFLNWLL